MKNIDKDIIAKAKGENNIVDVIREAGITLTKSGRGYAGLCPFHKDSKPSFKVSEVKQAFNCFGCKVGGDIIKFLELHKKLSFRKAVNYLLKRAG